MYDLVAVPGGAMRQFALELPRACRSVRAAD